MRLRLISLILSIISVGLFASAQNTTVTGVVRDAQTLEPVPFASVLLKGTSRGVISDDLGRFSISTSLRFDSIEASAMGYETRSFPVGARKPEIKLDLKLKPTGVLLGTVVATNKREHYSKKNNPAVELMQRIRSARDVANPRTRHPHYNYDKYERITLAINNYHHTEDTTPGKKPGRFDFVKEYIDTSVLTGQPILNISVREKAAEVHHRRDPQSEKEYVTGLRRSGFDEMFDQESTQRLYEDVMREIDVYDNDIPLLQVRFVSPLSRIAPDFYKFYITDTVAVDSVPCYELTFVPRNTASMGFTGRFYVPLGDTTMFIRKIVMRVPHHINLNFIQNMLITQEFRQAPDGTRLKMTDEIVMDAQLVPGTPGLYARRRTVYTDHNFDKLEDQSIFDRGLSQIFDPAAYARDEAFWAGERTAPITDSEKDMEHMMKRFRKVPIFYWGEKVLKAFTSGYIATSPHGSKFDIGPLTSTVSSNSVEGFRLRLGGITTANLSKRWFGRGYAAYGFKDHKWKYSAELEYSFTDKKYHSREFPVHSLRLTHAYDMNMLGQHFTTNNQDNMFLSFRRAEDVQMLYQRVTKLEYTLETESRFSVVGTLKHERQEPTKWMPFIDGYGRKFGHYNLSTVSVALRYAPGEKFYQMKTGRLPINFDAPVFQLSHTWGPRGFAGNVTAVSTTEFSFSKRFWLSAYGSIDFLLKGGHTWTRSNYPNLLIPNANLSYFIQAEAFSLLNPMEFINDSYAQWDFTYWANGALLNNIPLLKRLKLREALIFRGLWGHLSPKNRPWNSPELYEFPKVAHTTLMNTTPYMEIGIGLDNVFKLFRVDYTWRLSYRHTPDACLHGIRFMFHPSF